MSLPPSRVHEGRQHVAQLQINIPRQLSARTWLRSSFFETLEKYLLLSRSIRFLGLSLLSSCPFNPSPLAPTASKCSNFSGPLPADCERVKREGDRKDN